MASHERRIRAAAAVSPPYSADIYWNVTLASMRRELASLYGITEAEMGAAVDKITLADVLGDLRSPLMLAGGGHDLITPGSEAWRIFEGARCERELVFYPRGAHDCFNVLADLRPRWRAGSAARAPAPPRGAPPSPSREAAGARPRRWTAVRGRAQRRDPSDRVEPRDRRGAPGALALVVADAPLRPRRGGGALGAGGARRRQWQRRHAAGLIQAAGRQTQNGRGLSTPPVALKRKRYR
jgi:hypothetical protein